MNILFHKQAFEDFQFWIKTDKKKTDKILKLLQEISREPFNGIGKPEPLKHELKGFWSRRIDEEHRLVYQIKENDLIIISCKYHY